MGCGSMVRSTVVNVGSVEQVVTQAVSRQYVLLLTCTAQLQ